MARSIAIILIQLDVRQGYDGGNILLVQVDLVPSKLSEHKIQNPPFNSYLLPPMILSTFRMRNIINNVKESCRENCEDLGVHVICSVVSRCVEKTINETLRFFQR